MKGQKEPSAVSLPRSRLWGWSQSFKGIKLSVPGNLAFPCEEAGVIVPKAAVYLVCHALEIARVPLVQHSWTSQLRTVSLYGSCC